MDEGIDHALGQTLPNDGTISDDGILIIIPRIFLRSGAEISKYVEQFSTLSDFSYYNEAKTWRFAAMQPIDAQSSGEIVLLEHFESASALSYHRSSTHFKEMFSWLVDTKPNGPHPLPLPITLNNIGFSVTKPTKSWTPDPFIVLDHVDLRVDIAGDIQAELAEAVEMMHSDHNGFMILGGNADSALWIVSVFKDEQSFCESKIGKMAPLMGQGQENWERKVVKLVSGFLGK